MTLMKSKLMADADGISSMSKEVRVIGFQEVAKLSEDVTLQCCYGRC